MKNIFILPAKSFKSKLAMYRNKEYTELHGVGELAFCKDDIGWSELWRPLELYVTSEEALKPGDWYINTFLALLQQEPEIHAKKSDFVAHKKDPLFKYCKKIVLTTDSDLIKDAIQAIDNEFLEWFVQNLSCEKVEIKHIIKEYVDDQDAYGYDASYYTIAIPKKEPIHTSYTGKVWEPSKQETVEEAAEKYWSRQPYNEDPFVEGVKWQQERSYSKEEVWKLVNKLNQTLNIGSDLTLEEWFKQFKKK